MIRFDSDSKENMQQAYIDYIQEISPLTPGKYLIAQVKTYSSEGNTYYIDGDYDSEPTDEQLRNRAESDWKDYCEGIYPDDEKEERIEKFLDSYIVVDRDELYPLYTVTSMSRETGDSIKYFLTVEEARAEAVNRVKTSRLTKNDARENYEQIDKVFIDDYGNEGSDSIEDIPYLQKFWVSLGYGEKDTVKQFDTYGTMEAPTSKEAAQHIYNELEPEDTKNLIIETKLYSGYSQAEYFDVDDFGEEPEL